MTNHVPLDHWTKMWASNATGWHLSNPHYSLVEYMNANSNTLPNQAKIFVPLCGKSVDIKWLYDRGYVVHGVEYESVAIEEFFKTFNMDFVKTKLSDDVTVYKNNDSKIQLFQCDFFKFNNQFSGCKYHLIWDRASFVAINVQDRAKYEAILKNLLVPEGKILLSSLNYTSATLTGPPFSVAPQDIENYFGLDFDIRFLSQIDISDQPLFKSHNAKTAENLHILTLK